MKANSIFYILSMALFLFVSCAQEKEDIDLKNMQSNVDGSTYKLSFGHDMPTNSPQHRAAEEFAKRVKDKSHGKILVDIFPNQELGTDEEMISMAQRGDLAITLPPTAKLTTMVPSLQILDFPFFFNSKDSVYDFLDGPLGKFLLKEVGATGLVGVAYWESGMKQFTANKTLRDPSDFEGLNFRIMKSPALMEQTKLLGANPIRIDFHKIRQALKDKAIDVQENSLTSIARLELNDFQSHLIISNHSYLAQIFCFSEKHLQRFPENIRDILISTAQELVPILREEVARKEPEHIRNLEKSGMKITSLTSDEKYAFARTLNPIIEKFRFEVGTDFIERSFHFLNKRNPFPDEYIYIGLDADLTAQAASSGLAIKRGIELAIDEINQAGGILGKKLRLISMDHSGISARGIENMKFFSTVPNFIAVVGGLHSPVALSELDIIHKNKIIYLDPWAAATPIAENGFDPNYVFRISVRDKDAGGFFVNEALARGYKNIALLLENTGWGRSNEKAVKRALQKENINSVSTEWFNWGEKDFKPLLRRVQKSGADVILLVANATEGKLILTKLRELGINLPIISHWGITGGELSRDIPKVLSQTNLLFLQTYSFLNSNRSRTNKVISAYKSKYFVKNKKKIIAPVGTAHAYDLIHLLKKAIDDTGSFERSRIRNALEQIKFHEGLIKDYNPPFTREKHDALGPADFFLARYDHEGDIIPHTEQ